MSATPADRVEVGRIAKAHGLRGEVIVSFVSDRPERRAVGAVLDTAVRPLTVVTCTAHQHRWIVAFAGVEDREAAEALHGLALSAPPLPPIEGEVYPHEVVGKRLIEVSGTDRGEVVAIEANPAADLLVLDDGSVVPLTFVTDIDDDRVLVDAPDGLFDL